MDGAKVAASHAQLSRSDTTSGSAADGSKVVSLRNFRYSRYPVRKSRSISASSSRRRRQSSTMTGSSEERYSSSLSKVARIRNFWFSCGTGTGSEKMRCPSHRIVPRASLRLKARLTSCLLFMHFGRSDLSRRIGPSTSSVMSWILPPDSRIASTSAISVWSRRRCRAGSQSETAHLEALPHEKYRAAVLTRSARHAAECAITASIAALNSGEYDCAVSARNSAESC